jgi:two-component system KDP operon response regulator KdpE
MEVRKILVVDDEPQMRRVLRASLVASGYQVMEAGSGEEALAQLGAEDCDFILLDLNLPGIDGITTCRAIRSKSRVPIVIVSVRVSPEDKQAARSAGANDYITKPFAVEELLAKIRSIAKEKPEHA